MTHCPNCGRKILEASLGCPICGVHENTRGTGVESATSGGTASENYGGDILGGLEPRVDKPRNRGKIDCQPEMNGDRHNCNTLDYQSNNTLDYKPVGNLDYESNSSLDYKPVGNLDYVSDRSLDYALDRQSDYDRDYAQMEAERQGKKGTGTLLEQQLTKQKENIQKAVRQMDGKQKNARQGDGRQKGAERKSTEDYEYARRGEGNYADSIGNMNTLKMVIIAVVVLLLFGQNGFLFTIIVGAFLKRSAKPEYMKLGKFMIKFSIILFIITFVTSLILMNYNLHFLGRNFLHMFM